MSDPAQARLTELLAAGRVPGRLLYEAPGQAERWLAYHRAWAPAGRAAATLAALYDAAFEAAWSALDAGPMTYVGLGCGGGAKDARFFTVGPAGQPARYVAADASPELVATALAAVAAARPDVTGRGVVFDLMAPPPRDELLGPGEHPRVVWSCLGILPNVDADHLLPLLARLAGPRDVVLLSTNLSPAPHPDAVPRIVPQYDNDEARAWYQGALAALGAADARLTVGHRALTPSGVVWRVEATAEVAGRRLEVFHSDRYLPEAMPALFAQHGLTLEGAWVAEDREEGTYLLRVTDRPGPAASST